MPEPLLTDEEKEWSVKRSFLISLINIAGFIVTGIAYVILKDPKMPRAVVMTLTVFAAATIHAVVALMSFLDKKSYPNSVFISVICFFINEYIILHLP